MKLINVVLATCLASAFPLKQFILFFMANKKTILLLAFLDFVGANHCFIGVLILENKVVAMVCTHKNNA